MLALIIHFIVVHIPANTHVRRLQVLHEGQQNKIHQTENKHAEVQSRDDSSEVITTYHGAALLELLAIMSHSRPLIL